MFSGFTVLLSLMGGRSRNTRPVAYDRRSSGARLLPTSSLLLFRCSSSAPFFLVPVIADCHRGYYQHYGDTSTYQLRTAAFFSAALISTCLRGARPKRQ
ncbi:uncharacterized protein BT62DRAFT_269011 [Guyanagaster necrorhizus]|uniref:Uncharacterized protein n=1 Tax=Guyanagaster necrorhizus TaxID=856835 RepID=A0A9P7W3F9_9AGAR|nr:uncharacterized protein BT62DRAFT_269011 [Guyanagaster necrorhizus MCA 3950]KAG7451869.1 hypothetical protein BT62DRAFT_269011 [Guyanagaster necrorhizus MCA 3950]